MPSIKSPYKVIWFTKIADIAQQDWDNLALPLPTPFLEWEWLYQLEASGSVGPETGWQPVHLTVWKNHGSISEQLVAAAPLFIKTHSEGEFVFDYFLAEVADQLHIPYYPKLVGMSPFSPVPAYRFLIARGEDEESFNTLLFKEIDLFCQAQGLASCQFNYTDPAWSVVNNTTRFFRWKHQVFSWYNPGLTSFDDYLRLFNKNQRRNIKRERKKLEEGNLHVESYSGQAIPDYLFPLMYDLYKHTNDKFGPWGCKYLTPEFFEGIKKNFKTRLLIMAAFQDGEKFETEEQEPVGMSFFLVKNANFYGRYWGSPDYIDALHFNLCFYSPIEWAINHQIRHFDPGIGSSHKTRRGFIAIPNYSLHHYYQPSLEKIMNLSIDKINEWEEEQILALNSHLPFAQSKP